MSSRYKVHDRTEHGRRRGEDERSLDPDPDAEGVSYVMPRLDVDPAASPESAGRFLPRTGRSYDTMTGTVLRFLVRTGP